MTAARALDAVYTVAHLDRLEAERGAIGLALSDEVPTALERVTDIEQLESSVERTITGLDAMCVRAMKALMERDLASDTSIAPPTRTVFASTVVGYDGRLDMLADRVRDVAARGGANEPGRTAVTVVAAAERVITLRRRIVEDVLAIVSVRARAALAVVQPRARDRRRDDAERMRDSALRRELEAMASEPDRIASAPVTQRLASWPALIDEAPAEDEPTWADMIELD